MTGDCHVRFLESVGVKLPCATYPSDCSFMKLQTQAIDGKSICPFVIMPKEDGLGRPDGSAAGSGWVFPQLKGVR